MPQKIATLALLVVSLLAGSPAYSLTVVEVLALKNAGVGDDTIQMLIEAERQGRAVADRIGHYRTSDGWLVHTTPGSVSSDISPNSSYGSYPFCISPSIFPTFKRPKHK